MPFGTSLLLSNSPLGTTWSLPSAGFTNPSYLGGDLNSAGAYQSDGFQIEQGAIVVIAFEGTYTGQTVIHQQTLDTTGATGWCTVSGYAIDGSGSGSGVSTSGVAYAFPAMGMRHRIQVTALSTGTLVARASLQSDPSVTIGDVLGGSQGALPTIVGNRTPKGYQQIVGLASATTLTVPSGSKIALITCESQAVRWRDDGTNPTASVGMELLVGQALLYDGTLSTIAFIQEAATANLNVSYYA